MIYINVTDAPIEGHRDLSVSVDNTTVYLGLIPLGIVEEVLQELRDSIDLDLNKLDLLK